MVEKIFTTKDLKRLLDGFISRTEMVDALQITNRSWNRWLLRGGVDRRTPQKNIDRIRAVIRMVQLSDKPLCARDVPLDLRPDGKCDALSDDGSPCDRDAHYSPPDNFCHDHVVLLDNGGFVIRLSGKIFHHTRITPMIDPIIHRLCVGLGRHGGPCNHVATPGSRLCQEHRQRLGKRKSLDILDGKGYTRVLTLDEERKARL